MRRCEISPWKDVFARRRCFENVDYALRWLEESSLESNEFAEYLLGKTYLKGEDVEQDLIRAEDLLWKSSAQGNKYAKYTLGKSLLDGNLFLQIS